MIAVHMARGATRHLKRVLKSEPFVRVQHLELLNVDVDVSDLNWRKYGLKTLKLGDKQKLNQNLVYQILQSCPSLTKASFSSVQRGGDDRSYDHWASQTDICIPAMEALTIGGDLTSNASFGVLAWPVSGNVDAQ